MTLDAAASLRYSVKYCVTTFQDSFRQYLGKYYDFSFNNDEVIIRPPAFVGFTLAVAAFTNLSDGGQPVVNDTDRAFAIRLLTSLAKAHVANGGFWGNQWQSALWASRVGCGAWMLWDYLDPEDQEYVRNMVIYEADRFLGMSAPVWSGPGDPDTKAEEDAWNASIDELAASMMPGHRNASAWLEKSIEYRLNSKARKSDLSRNEIMHGRPLQNWLLGYNIYEDGSVINHGIYPNPDYIGAIPALTNFGAVVFPLAGKRIPVAVLFNQDLVYYCLADREWSSGEYAPPGGTIYQSDGSIYWPPLSGAEIERKNSFYIWAMADASANLLGFDNLTKQRGDYWERLHGKRLLQDQSARLDGSCGESIETGGKDAEYNAVEIIAMRYMLHWLKYQGVIGFTNELPENFPQKW